MLFLKFFRKVHKPHINATDWHYVKFCPKCKGFKTITAQNLRVTYFADWNGKRFYEFRSRCNSCKKLLLVISKDKIPDEVRENVLAERTPILYDGHFSKG